MNYSSLFTKRKDGRYQAIYTDTDGKIKYLYDRDPKRLYDKLQDATKPPRITFKDAAGAWENAFTLTCNPRTWMNYKPHLESLIEIYGKEPIENISGTDVIQDLQRAKAKQYSRTIVNTRRTLFNNVLNYSVAQGWIPYNPAIGIKLPKGLPSSKRSSPTDDEIRKIIANVKCDFGFFAFLLLCTGLRKGEALALLKSDIHDDEILVTKSLTLLDGQHPKVKEPKSEAGKRVIPIVGILKEPLEEYMKTIPDNVLFPARGYHGTPDGVYMSQSNYDTAWKHYCEETGLDLTAHQLRHGTATLLYEAGVDVYTARKILGHSKVSTTMEIYTELREQRERKSITLLDTYMSNLVSNPQKNEENQ